MSRAEAQVLIARLAEAMEALRDATNDLRECPDVPQHVIEATRSPLNHIHEAAAEIARLHNIGVPT